jgi:serine/threonine protein kinase
LIVSNTKKIENTIGNGSFGRVYLVKIDDDQEYAVKKSKDLFSNTEQERAALEELKFMTDDTYLHENLMSAEHYFFHKHRLYIVMKKMDGSLSQLIHQTDERTQELKQLLKNQPDQLLYLLIQIAKGIQKLHSHDTMHRDIKSDNVLISQKIVDGRHEIDKVKLSDFGISKKATVANSVVGTIDYMAPEVKNPESEGYTTKADIYSFGIMIGEIVCSTKRVNTQEYTRQNFKNAGYEYLYNLYDKCTKHEPKERPAIDQVITELELEYERAKLNRCQERTMKMISEIEKAVNTIQSQFKSHWKRIEEAKNNLIRCIEDRADELKMDLEEKGKSAIADLTDYKQNLEDIKNNINESCFKSLHRIEKQLDLKERTWIDLDYDIQNLKKLTCDLHESIRKLETDSKMNNNLLSNLEMRLNTNELFEKIKNWGSTEVLTLSIKDCDVFGVLDKVLLNEKAQFRIYLKTKDGKNIRAVSPVVHITDAQRQKLNPEIEYNESKGFYRVSYTPTTNGLHAIQVLINDEIINQRPYLVQPVASLMKHKNIFGKRGTEKDQFNFPYYAAADKNGFIYVCDSCNGRIQIFHPNGEYSSMFVSDTQGKYTMKEPAALAFNSKGELIVADQGNDQILVFNESFQPVKAFGSKGKENGEFDRPCALAIDREDNIIVVDS